MAYGLRSPVQRRIFIDMALVIAAAWLLPVGAQTMDDPDILVKKLSDDMVQTLKTNKDGIRNDMRKIAAYVDARIMPVVDLDTMVAGVVGQPYNAATPEQKSKLQNSYKNLLIRTYSGVLKSFNEQRIEVRMLKNAPQGQQQEIKTRIVGAVEPLSLDYRLEKGADGAWKIYDVAAAGAWMSNTYKGQYGPIARDKGLDAAAAAMDKGVAVLDKE